MANRDKATFPVFAVLMLLLLLAAIGFGIMMFVSERDTVTHDEEGERAIRTEDEVEVDTLAQGLTIAEYEYDPATGELSGSVMNGTNRHFVNIQIEFVYLDLDGDSAGVLRDTTRELAAGETWRFSVPVEEDEGVSRVLPGRVSGAEREVVGAEASTPRRGADTRREGTVPED